MDLEYIIGFDALHESMKKCQRGVIWKDSVAHFVLNHITEIEKLERSLKAGTYKPKHMKPFPESSPKRRIVMGVPFRDRIFQRSLNDNAIYPNITKHFIYDNAACQKGKGTDFARGRFHRHLQKFFRQHGLAGHCLKCDIAGYYQNMRHDVVMGKFARHLPPEVFALAEMVLTNQYDGDTGYLPGSQMIQIAGIATLDDLDHFIKERLRIKYYLRYMDDFILIHEDRDYLEYCRREIAAELSKIGFTLHPKKTMIQSIAQPIKLLGFTHQITQTGKIIMLVDPKNVKNERKKLRRMVAKAKRGDLTRAKVDECYTSWRAHASHGNSHNLLKRMDKYYADLWG